MMRMYFVKNLFSQSDNFNMRALGKVMEYITMLSTHTTCNTVYIYVGAIDVGGMHGMLLNLYSNLVWNVSI